MAWGLCGGITQLVVASTIVVHDGAEIAAEKFSVYIPPIPTLLLHVFMLQGPVSKIARISSNCLVERVKQDL
jgi:hypothetical protein